ncbi:MAG: hypothetical protein ACC700_14685, partial [Anaerolineales bacterium]
MPRLFCELVEHRIGVRSKGAKNLSGLSGASARSIAELLKLAAERLRKWLASRGVLAIVLFDFLPDVFAALIVARQ